MSYLDLALRQPNIFKSVTGTSASTTVWTPTSGKRFRLLKYAIEITAQAALGAAGNMTMSFLDNGAAVGLLHSVYLPITASAGTAGGNLYSTGWVDLGGNGYRSTAVDQVLTLSAASITNGGLIRIRVAGIEEE